MLILLNFAKNCSNLVYLQNRTENQETTINTQSVIGADTKSFLAKLHSISLIEFVVRCI